METHIESYIQTVLIVPF